MGDPRKTKAIRAALIKKGFVADDTHHEMFWLVADGKKTSVRTRISHGAKEYGDELLSLVARQVGVSKQELHRLVDCPMDGARLIALLIERGRVRM
ncbi:MAG: hypothetical protein M1550_03075 [Deltaproteobacteria bacterium]|nr:hypothetical protein [Deltaproteobacteria bacterium]